ncbi:Na+/H+ antiporter subunit E [Amphibiibacter pelophylacis]|uniref:Na+/H+ antiporter subunit E n=1 Tax=Amphibiibacter pelophylacis TaxID=1799477 RepID=A0ACC6P0B4_9BURK
MKPLRRPLWPHPLWSLILAASWLLLNQTLAPGHLLWALLLAFVLPRWLHPFLLPVGHIHWRWLPGLVGVVLFDIVKSALILGRQVLGRTDTLQPAWVCVPLASEHVLANALLASIVTTTPGTMSVDIDPRRRCLWVHAVHAPDAQGVADDIRTRYERPLLRLFGLPEMPT